MEGGLAFSSSRIEFEIPGTYVTLRRKRLDELVARGAVEAGAVFTRAEVTGIRGDGRGGVVLETGTGSPPLKASCALVATGARTGLPRRLGLLERSAPSGVSARCYFESSLELDRLVISCDRAISPGYGWIFPLGSGRFNAGVVLYGREGGRGGPGLRSVFSRFLRDFPLARDLARFGKALSPLRAGMLRCGLEGTRIMGEGNVLVIGEAIGSTVPLVGAGIGDAMFTGEKAAGFVHDAISSGDWERLNGFSAFIEQDHAPLYRGFEAGKRWMSVPWLNDLLARRMRSSPALRSTFRRIVRDTSDPKDLFEIRGILGAFW
jgi:flavin-dependent dehydrogenase